MNLSLGKLITLNPDEPSCLRSILIALLTVGLVLSLDFLYHPALSGSSDLINLMTNQAPNSQMGSQSDGPTLSQHQFQLALDPLSIISIFVGIILFVFQVITWVSKITTWVLNTWCPQCKHFGLIKRTAVVSTEPTEKINGARLISESCKCCRYKKQWQEPIPPNGSDFSCTCM